MAVTSGPHKSPQSGLPDFSEKQINTFTWDTGGNTVTVTDAYVHPNSRVDFWVTGTTPQLGRWAITVNQGSFTITSSDPENSALTVSYIVL